MSKIWWLQGMSVVFPLLKQTYFSMPSCVQKRCFQFFLFFLLIIPLLERHSQMWIIEGNILEQDENDIDMNLAYETYERFKFMSFFCNNGKIHDLIQCLSCHVSRKFYKYLSDEDNLQDFNVSSRHMSFIGISYHTKTFELLKKLAKVRTILLKFSFDSFLSTLSKWAVLDYVIQLIG